MAEWAWEGKTRAGEVKRGVVVAPNEREAHNRLRNRLFELIRESSSPSPELQENRTKIAEATRIFLTRRIIFQPSI